MFRLTMRTVFTHIEDYTVHNEINTIDKWFAYDVGTVLEFTSVTQTHECYIHIFVSRYFLKPNQRY